MNKSNSGYTIENFDVSYSAYDNNHNSKMNFFFFNEQLRLSAMFIWVTFTRFHVLFFLSAVKKKLLEKCVKTQPNI